MKRNFVQIFGLVSALTSTTAMAHVGPHGVEGFLSGVLHMLADHGYLLGLAAAAVAMVVLKRSQRV
ncbi:MAG: hypothetical protein ABW140_14230 [Candidatus Sedimenticola sp. 6PFRAG1]